VDFFVPPCKVVSLAGQCLALLACRVPLLAVPCQILAMSLELSLVLVEGGLHHGDLLRGRVALLARALQFAVPFTGLCLLPLLVLVEPGLKRFPLLLGRLVFSSLPFQLFLESLLGVLVCFQLSLQCVVTLLPVAFVLLSSAFQFVAEPAEGLIFLALRRVLAS